MPCLRFQTASEDAFSTVLYEVRMTGFGQCCSLHEEESWVHAF